MNKTKNNNLVADLDSIPELEKGIVIALPKDIWEEIASACIYIVNQFEGVNGLIEPFEEALQTLRKTYFTIKDEIR